MFEIGEKVICVEDYKLPHTREELDNDCPNWVKKDEKYTIRGFNDNNGIVTGVLLEEIRNSPKYFKVIDKIQEPAFRTDRFRRLEPAEKQEEVEEFKMVA